MDSTIVAALVRHILTAIAGGFAVKYGVDGADIDVVISGMAAAAGVGWSLMDKSRRRQH